MLAHYFFYAFLPFFTLSKLCMDSKKVYGLFDFELGALLSRFSLML